MTESEQILKNLGSRIADLRRQKGLSQEAFAEISGKMINTVSNIERGLSDPKITTLMSFSKALGISLGELFADGAYRQNEENLPEDVLVIIGIIKKMDKKSRRVILKQIQALAELV